MRVVLDANVLVSALVSPRGIPAKIMVAWEEGAFGLVVSEQLISELERVFEYPKLKNVVDAADVGALIQMLRQDGMVVQDVTDPPAVCADKHDDYLIALASKEGVPIVTGDRHLLDLADRLPILAPRAFLELVA